jgi:diguanylate cyclase (GGDEF)-like protein
MQEGNNNNNNRSGNDKAAQGEVCPANIQSLYVGFSLIILIISLLTFFGVSRHMEVNRKLDSVVSNHNVRMDLALQLRVISRERAPLLYAMASTEDPFDRDDMKQEFMRLGEAFLKTRGELVASGLNQDEARLLEEHRQHAKTVVPQQHHVVALTDEGRLAEAREFLISEMVPTQAKALKQIDRFIGYQQKAARTALKEAKAITYDTYFWAALLSGAGILLSLIIAMVVSRRLGRMVGAITQARDELEQRVVERTHELSAANEQLEQLANFDSLTGLPNRTSFYANLELAISQARQRNGNVGLMFLDLDGFKAVNDTYGHDYGDDLLCQVAERMQQVLRDTDVSCRLGGDEFTVILPGIKEVQRTALVAQKLIDALNKPFRVKGDTDCTIGVSIGIAVYPLHAQTGDQLVKVADDLMYRVKKSGKNTFLLCD